MKRYDVVIPKPRVAFACGSGLYTHAIVMHVKPFVLVSEESDMRWTTTIKPDDCIVVGRASWRTRLRIQRRRWE